MRKSKIVLPANKEIWTITREETGRACIDIGGSPMWEPHGQRFFLHGSHPVTKEVKHTYGPFVLEEIRAFAATNSITLP